MSSGDQTLEQLTASFNKGAFAILSIAFAIPYLVCAAIAFFLLYKANFRVSRWPSYIATWKAAFMQGEKFSTWKWVFLILFWLILVAPVILMLCWGIVVAALLVPSVVGLFVLFLGLSFTFGTFSFLSWSKQKWQVSKSTIGTATTSLLFLCATQLSLALSQSTFSFFGISSIFLSFNMYPVIAVVFMWAPGKRDEFKKFVSVALGNEGVDELKKLIRGASNDPATEKTRRMKTTAILYAISLAIMLTYAIIALILLPSTGGAGFATMGAVIVLDIAIYMLYRAGELKDPAIICAFLTLCRGFLVGFGATYYFIGHSFVFLVFGLILTNGIVRKWLKIEGKTEKIRNALGKDDKNLKPEGEAGVTPPPAELHTDDPKPVSSGKFNCIVPWGSMFGIEGTLVLVFVCFLVDLIIAAVLRSSIATIQLTVTGSAHAQWLFGLAAMALSLVIPMITASIRSYRKSDTVRPSKMTLIWAGLAELAIILCGVIFFLLTNSLVILLSSIFGPLIIICGIVSYFLWKENDYKMLKPIESRQNIEENGFISFFKCTLPKGDYLLIGSWFSTLLFTVLFGMVLALTNTPGYVGWSLMCAIIIVICTILPLNHWFNTFKIGVFSIVSTSFGALTLILHHVLFATTASPSSAGTLALIITGVGYPVLIVLIGTIVKWRDDGWKISKPVIISLSGLGVVFLVGVVCISALLSPWQIGISLLGVFLVIVYCITIATLWIKRGYYLPRKFYISSIGVLLMLVGLGIVVGTYSAFLGFSIAMLALVLVLVAAAANRILQPKPAVRYISEHLFPIFKYDPSSDDVKSSLLSTMLLLCAAFVTLFWGLAATIFMSPQYVGFAVIGVITIGTPVWFMMIRRQQAVKFAEVSPWTSVDLIKKSLQMAAKKQFGRDDQDEMEIIDDSADVEAGGTASGGKFGRDGPTLEELWTQLDAQEIAAGSDQNLLKELIVLQANIDRIALEEKRFLAHGEILTTLAAVGARRQDEALFLKFLRETGQSEITADQIHAWTDEEREEFNKKREQWLEESKKKEAESKKRREEDEEAAKRRKQIALEEERKRREIEQKELEVKRKAEEEKKKQEEEKERKRIAQLSEEKRAEEEEKKRLEAEEERKKAAEEEERKRKEIEERKKQQQPTDEPELDEITQKLIDKARGGSGLYEDPEFPKDGDPVMSRVAEMARPSDIAETPALFKDDVNPSDISQGMLGDCWYLSAISVLALQPERLKSVFLITDESKGFAVVRFYKNGEWMNVLIDDRVPVSRNMKPVFAHSKDENEMWVALLEKAYAKVHAGYGNIEGGLVHLALVDLTGGASEQTDLAARDTQLMVNTGALFDRLLKYKDAGYMMGCGSPSGSDSDISAEGIVQGHAYAILDVQSVDGNKLLKLRNPWGRCEWNGDWSDDWEGWTTRLKAKLGYEKADDGSFWISFDDWVQNFKNLYVCRLFSDAWNTVRLTGKWEGDTAGGCPSKKNVNAPKNPQYHLKLSRPTHCFITLSQDDPRGKGREEYHMAFFVLNKNGKRCAGIYKGDKVGSSGNYINRREVSAELFLEPQPNPFTIFCSTYQPGQECGFILTVHSDYPVELTEIPADAEVD